MALPNWFVGNFEGDNALITQSTAAVAPNSLPAIIKLATNLQRHLAAVNTGQGYHMAGSVITLLGLAPAEQNNNVLESSAWLRRVRGDNATYPAAMGTTAQDWTSRAIITTDESRNAAARVDAGLEGLCQTYGINPSLAKPIIWGYLMTLGGVGRVNVAVADVPAGINGETARAQGAGLIAADATYWNTRTVGGVARWLSANLGYTITIPGIYVPTAGKWRGDIMHTPAGSATTSGSKRKSRGGRRKSRRSYY